MGIGITFSINEDGTIEIENREANVRDKGKSLITIPNSYTVIDIETTGLDPRYDEIIEIGAIKVEEGIIIDKFESLIKPNGYYFYDDDGNEYFSYVDEFITELTGITNEMLETAPDIENVLPKFVDFIKDDILAGHNVNFDINFLYDNLMDELDYRLSNDFVDLMRLTRKIYPDYKNHKLKTISENLNIDTSNHHRAIGDCEITYNCFMKLLDHINKNNIDLNNLFSKKYNYQQTDLRELKANTDIFNEEHPLFNKYCTFTGKLEKMDRKDAAQLVVNLGGICLNGVTKQTNFLILGNFDYSSNVKDGKSSKLKKAEELILKGQDLQILSENVFYDLISEE